MAECMPLMDWERGVHVGWWQDIGPEGYWWLRLPGGGKVLWPRQLWMDRNGRRLVRGRKSTTGIIGGGITGSRTWRWCWEGAYAPGFRFVVNVEWHEGFGNYMGSPTTKSMTKK